jgi:AraC family transcriptional activator of pobA
MKLDYKDVKTIGDVHRLYNCGKPKHPLITVIDLTEVDRDLSNEDIFFRTGFYTVMCKKFDGVLKYGRSHYDFEEGTLMFTSPNQVISSSPDSKILEGWDCFFTLISCQEQNLAKRFINIPFFSMVRMRLCTYLKMKR